MTTLQFYLEQMISCGQTLAEEGLVRGAAGNITCKLDSQDFPQYGRKGGVLITGSGSVLGSLRPENLVVVLSSGDVIVPSGGENPTKPSSELPMHQAVYNARPDVGAIVHMHSPYATALAAAHLGIPAFLDEMTFILGGSVAVTEYGYPGSTELGLKVVKALGEKQGVLIANHGALAVGKDLKECLKVASLIEEVARVYLLVQEVGGPVPIPQEALDRQIAAFNRRKGRG